MNGFDDRIGVWVNAIGLTGFGERVKIHTGTGTGDPITKQDFTSSLFSATEKLKGTFSFWSKSHSGQDAERLTGLKERNVSTVLSRLIHDGILRSATPKGPVSLHFGSESVEFLFKYLKQIAVIIRP